MLKLALTFLLVLITFSASGQSFSKIKCEVGYHPVQNSGFYSFWEETLPINEFSEFKAILPKSQTRAPEDLYFGAAVEKNGLRDFYLMTDNAATETAFMGFTTNTAIDVHLTSRLNNQILRYRARCTLVR